VSKSPSDAGATSITRVPITLQGDGVLDLGYRVYRRAVREAGKVVGRFGSFEVLPVDHRAVISRTEDSFTYGEIEAQILRNLPTYKDLIRRMEPEAEKAQRLINDAQTDDTSPFWSNTYFQGNDARVVWALTALAKPKLIVEIGSGNSTKFFRHSIKTNGLDTKLICLDPVPRASVAEIATKIEYKTVQTADKAVFSQLQAGDILFLDGSHLVVQGSDTQYFFLEILPHLAKGVIVQIHDINLPFEYREFYNGLLYGEQYMLAAVLTYSKEWETLMPIYWLEQEGLLPNKWHPGASFWITNDLPAVRERLGLTS